MRARSSTSWEIIEGAIQEAEQRDPAHDKTWVAVVDGNKEQLRILRKLARRHGVVCTIALDIIHVLECLWKAAYVFHADGSQEAERWVSQRRNSSAITSPITPMVGSPALATVT